MPAERSKDRRNRELSALGRLAAGLAHDLGNTLNALSLRVDRLAHHATVEDRPDLHAIEEAISVMRQTLDRLDRFSGRRSRPLAPVDLAKVIRAAISVANLHDVALELPRRLPRVAGDAAELTNVFVNLLLNARDAMPDGGTVTIDAVAEPHTVVVRVRDEGPGFQPDQLERLFEPFFTTKGARGSGLGLSLAYGLMAAIGGTIRAANRSGGGAEIVLELPIARRRSVSRV